MDNIITLNLKSQRQRIRACAQEFKRKEDILLVAVSKTKSIELIRAAYQEGQRDFGENYIQEALPKMEALQDLPLRWHFIGRVQSNKARLLAEHFDWVQSVSALKVARRLNEYCDERKESLNICIQVNISEEEGKSGCHPQEVMELCQAVQAYPHLALRGLMAIPVWTADEQEKRKPFARLANIFHRVRRELAPLHWDTLSMGMTGDLEAAVQEGATMVRLGTAIFGARDTM